MSGYSELNGIIDLHHYALLIEGVKMAIRELDNTDNHEAYCFSSCYHGHSEWYHSPLCEKAYYEELDTLEAYRAIDELEHERIIDEAESHWEAVERRLSMKPKRKY